VAVNLYNSALLCCSKTAVSRRI